MAVAKPLDIHYLHHHLNIWRMCSFVMISLFSTNESQYHGGFVGLCQPNAYYIDNICILDLQFQTNRSLVIISLLPKSSSNLNKKKKVINQIVVKQINQSKRPSVQMKKRVTSISNIISFQCFVC